MNLCAGISRIPMRKRTSAIVWQLNRQDILSTTLSCLICHPFFSLWGSAPVPTCRASREQMEIRLAIFDCLPLLDLLLEVLITLCRPTGVEMFRRPNCEFRGFTEPIDAVDILFPSVPVIANECFLELKSVSLLDGLLECACPGGASDAPDADEARRARFCCILISAMPATVSAGPMEARETLLNLECLPGLGDGERDILSIKRWRLPATKRHTTLLRARSREQHTHASCAAVQ
mmetsp:Transcript_83722/g.157637  ORF Transcript_83722/g.157637 Transcript_83722/m.157637 type:complete len:234 (-) Transcript_83722:30-731(-)